MSSFFARVRASRVSQAVLVFVAAVASVATSQASWSRDAELPSERSPSSGKALRYHVEASQEPDVVVALARDAETLSRHAARRGKLGASWNGRSGDVIVLSGERLESVGIDGVCDGGCTCNPPDDANVTVAAPVVVPAWSIEEAKEVTLPSSCTSPVLELTVHYDEKGDSPSRFALRNADDLAGAHVTERESGQGMMLLEVSWDCSKRHSTTVLVAAIKDGVCSSEPCGPPASESIHVTSVDVRQGRN